MRGFVRSEFSREKRAAGNSNRDFSPCFAQRRLAAAFFPQPGIIMAI
jgi:hypothetical protein